MYKSKLIGMRMTHNSRSNKTVHSTLQMLHLFLSLSLYPCVISSDLHLDKLCGEFHGASVILSTILYSLLVLK